MELHNLDEDDFFEILHQPKNALLKQYAALLKSEDVDIEFTGGAVREIARIAFEVNNSVEIIGARRLHTILITLLEDILFDVPDERSGEHITIDDEEVRDRLSDIAQNRDLSQYIL